MPNVPFIVNADASNELDLKQRGLALVPDPDDDAGSHTLIKAPATGSWVALTSVAQLNKSKPGWMLVSERGATTRAQFYRVPLFDHPDHALTLT